MQTEEIDTIIKERAELESTEAAHEAGTAVLAELSRLNIGSEAREIAAQLPEEYKGALASGEAAEDLTRDTLLGRIESALDLDREAATRVTHATISVIADAVTPGERTSFVNALPEDISGLAVWS
ncbi:DUF2267 domain-containing protein [Nesterenkonia salmonea]|uniref:DUF2267 domain-containing protein n=1 Tax=Nesterenkonia salmonea TaxID=1804987 RepID=A0A5R9BAL6_9MICC|nr:DUF2267 domain-containing protein [Nesterenkonia salmonea]TLP97026.1 DUF2267 domain-containing protein [Nesterenkonia salmonea]